MFFFCLIRNISYFQQNSWWLILILHVLFFGDLNEVTVLYFGKDAKRQEACVSDTGFLHAFLQHYFWVLPICFRVSASLLC